MERSPVNPHAFDEVKLKEEANQKAIDRINAYQTDTRQRVDTLIKSVFILSGGALTISLGIFLRHEAPLLAPGSINLLKLSWVLLFLSLAASAIVLFIMICQGYYFGELWKIAHRTGENKTESSLVLKLLRIANWVFGTTGFISFLVGLALLACVSVSAVEEGPKSALRTSPAHQAKSF